MSRQNVEVVRQPIAVRAHTRRRPEERLGLRFPGALALLFRAVLRLRPRSRLRQAYLRRVAQLGVEAANRRDHKVVFAPYHPDVESIMPAEFVSLGFEPVYRGRDARVRFQDQWQADWGGFRFEPEELIDLGDRVLVVGHMKGSGLSSGAAVVNDWAVLFAFSGGRVRHEQIFFSRGAALDATGLSE